MPEDVQVLAALRIPSQRRQRARLAELAYQEERLSDVKMEKLLEEEEDGMPLSMVVAWWWL